MGFLIFISPLLLGILGNVFYNVVGKSTPEKINPFVSLAVTYCMALLVCIALFLLTKICLLLPLKQIGRPIVWECVLCLLIFHSFYCSEPAGISALDL